jgi:hypothetical protein
MIGVSVRMTMSLLVKTVSTLLNMKKYKNSFLPDEPDFFAALKARYSKKPVASIEMQT